MTYLCLQEWEVKMKQYLTKISLAFLSGILAFMAFPPFEIAFLAWVCLIPILFVVKKSGRRGSFFYSALAGLVFFAGLLYWLVNVTIPGMIILVIALSLFYGLFGLIANIVFKYSMDLLILPFVWVALEYIRSNIFTGFPWGLLGYTQYKNINLIQVADFAGAYGISFLLVVFNAALLAALFRSKRRIGYMMVALLFIVMATSYGIYKSDNVITSKGPEISLVQANIPQQHKWDSSFAKDIISRYTDLSRQAAKDEPDMIIWPETAYPYLIYKNSNSANEISELASSLKIPILTGVVSAEGDVYYNSAAVFDAGGKQSDMYHKLHLVPFGEYVPFERYLSFLRDHIDKPIGAFGRGGEYTLFSIRSFFSGGKDGVKTHRINFYKFGVLICFEDIFPYIARDFAIRKADFLVNITNDAWFGETAAARQHLQASVFRAVENRMPVVRSANTGISCFVDFMGRVYSIVEADGKEICVSGFSTADIKTCRGRSFYTMYGDIFVYFCAFMIALLFLTERFFTKYED